jgi:hypothetical protein
MFFVIRPLHKYRRAQVSCNAHGALPSPGRIDQILVKENSIHELRVTIAAVTDPLTQNCQRIY